MSFEVIPGGLLFADDVPAPNKPIEEWTEEEKTAYDRYLWENAEPGTTEHTIKHFAISSEDLNTIISTLEGIRTATAAAAAQDGYKSDFEAVGAEELLKYLKIKENAPW